MQPSDEAALVGAARSGDPGALASLVRRYQGSLLRFARSLLRSEALAEEAVQDTWLAVVGGGVESFEGRSAFKTWLFRILANRAATKATREGRSVPLSSVSTESEPSVSPDSFLAGFWKKPPSRWDAPSAEMSLHTLKIRQIVEAELENLPDAQKAVVVLRDVEGLESAEVCETLGISEANQRVLLHRGRSRLRAAVDAALKGGVR